MTVPTVYQIAHTFWGLNQSFKGNTDQVMEPNEEGLEAWYSSDKRNTSGTYGIKYGYKVRYVPQTCVWNACLECVSYIVTFLSYLSIYLCSPRHAEQWVC